MKRLLQIAFDIMTSSLIPVFTWLLLGIILDKNLINIFSIVYPMQFIIQALKTVFSTGANISGQKNKNPAETLSGFTIGIIIGAIVFGITLANVDGYISFMSMDPNIYREFTIYALIQMFFQLVLGFILNKLYYEDKNDLANKYSLTFNLLNIILVIIISLFIKNYLIIISTTLVILAIYITYITIKNISKFKFKLNLKMWIKYDLVDLISSLLFLLIFLFGLSNAFVYGNEYALAITFIALITDAQWDAYDAISVVSLIDLSRQDFNYRESLNNAYKLALILGVTTIIMGAILFPFYKLNILLTLSFLLFEVINWITYPVTALKTKYLQMQYSSYKIAFNKGISNILRFAISMLPTPFCTGIGQLSSAFYQLITISIIFHKKYLMNTDGKITKKEH